MNGHDNSVSSGFPSVRIWLCGPFRMEWVDPATGHASPLSDEALHGKDTTQVLSLLKVLLCQPGRQAHRDWLMEQFWPEHAQSVAIHRFHNVTAAFRKLLSPPDGVPLLPSVSGRKDSTSIYTLSAYPRLWVDSDAIVWNIEQAARMERFGEDALPFWQRAFALLKRGPFLPDEPYAAWAHAKHSELESTYRSCVHALSHLYLTRYGNAGKVEALLLLQTYWQQHKTDEDALRPLLELLGEQERYQEAEEYYQQLLLALAEEEPDTGGTPRQPDPRTRDIREYLRSKQIQREKQIPPPLQATQRSATFLLRQSWQPQHAYLMLPPDSAYHSSPMSLLEPHTLQEACSSLPSDMQGFSSSFLGQHSHDTEPMSQTTWLAFQETQLLTDILQGHKRLLDREKMHAKNKKEPLQEIIMGLA